MEQGTHGEMDSCLRSGLPHCEQMQQCCLNQPDLQDLAGSQDGEQVVHASDSEEYQRRLAIDQERKRIADLNGPEARARRRLAMGRKRIRKTRAKGQDGAVQHERGCLAHRNRTGGSQSKGLYHVRKKESEKHRQKRLADMRERQRQRLQNESEEQREKRLAANRERARVIRLFETSERREQRLTKLRERSCRLRIRSSSVDDLTDISKLSELEHKLVDSDIKGSDQESDEGM